MSRWSSKMTVAAGAPGLLLEELVQGQVQRVRARCR
jgi:hypothetical protein